MGFLRLGKFSISTCYINCNFSNLLWNSFVDSDYIEILGFDYKNTALIQHVTSLVFLLLAFLVPLMSGIADFLGNKNHL